MPGVGVWMNANPRPYANRPGQYQSLFFIAKIFYKISPLWAYARCVFFFNNVFNAGISLGVKYHVLPNRLGSIFFVLMR